MMDFAYVRFIIFMGKLCAWYHLAYLFKAYKKTRFSNVVHEFLMQVMDTSTVLFYLHGHTVSILVIDESRAVFTEDLQVIWNVPNNFKSDSIRDVDLV